jgi:hypothetical protein
MPDSLTSVPQVFLSIASCVAIGVVIMLPFVAIIWWVHRRDQRLWVVQQQVRELEQQIWERALPDWQREAILESRQRQAEIRREARRRLGWPEEG